MSDHLQEEQDVNENLASLHAESIGTTMAFLMVLKAALELGVIDTIVAAGDGAWLSPYEITVSLPTKPMNPEAPVLLDRMLRLLVSHSILKCRVIETGPTGDNKMVYAAKPVCKYFIKDSNGSGSLAPSFIMLHGEVSFKTWTKLKDVILEGKDAFNSVHGMRFFEYMDSNANFAEMFTCAMSEYSTIIMKRVLEVYKGFEDVNTLVDIGGSIGTNLGLITSKYPHIKGVNFDLPHVLTNASFYPGVEHVPGDMFVEVPKGDTIFMKSILHDWRDEDCIKILKNCWKSLPEKGKIILVEMVTPTEPKPGDFYSNVVLGLDSYMLINLSGGKERSLSQFENLAFSSGFSRCRFICLAYSSSVIEFYK